MHKNLGGDRGYLALADLCFESEFPRSNLPIQIVRRVGVETKIEKGVEQWMEAQER